MSTLKIIALAVKKWKLKEMAALSFSFSFCEHDPEPGNWLPLGLNIDLYQGRQ